MVDPRINSLIQQYGPDAVAGRQVVLYGFLTITSNGMSTKRAAVLFNDCLVLDTGSGSIPALFDLGKTELEDIDDHGSIQNAFRIKDDQKCLLVNVDTMIEKNNWIAKIKQCIKETEAKIKEKAEKCHNAFCQKVFKIRKYLASTEPNYCNICRKAYCTKCCDKLKTDSQNQATIICKACQNNQSSSNTVQMTSASGPSTAAAALLATISGPPTSAFYAIHQNEASSDSEGGGNQNQHALNELHSASAGADNNTVDEPVPTVPTREQMHVIRSKEFADMAATHPLSSKK